MERFSSDLSFNGEEAELKNIQLAHYESKVAGGATYNPSSHAFRFNLTGNNFDLTRISALQSARIAVTGRADFTAEGSGTLEAAALNAAIHLHDLTFDQERAGDFTINAVSQGAELRITGTIPVRTGRPQGRWQRSSARGLARGCVLPLPPV